MAAKAICQLLFVAAIALARVHAVPSVGVSGGYEVVPHSRPYQAAIYIPTSSSGKTLCGGSLITPQTVLTAATCFRSYLTRDGDLTVILGAHNILITEDTQIRVNTSDYIIHREWDKSPLYDIAVVRLPEPITLNENIQLIALPEKTDDDYIGKKVTVSGWGWISDYVRETPKALRAVDLPIIDNFACEVPYLGDVDETTLCSSGANGKASCVGDTGDPSVIDNVLVGIVSKRNPFLCEEGYPSAQVRVASFLDWIKENSI